MYACIFPGQGSQFVGMGLEFYQDFSTARQTFQEIDEALSQNLSKLIFEGPESELNQTVNTQPALMAVSLAIVQVLEKEFDFHIPSHSQCVAGHSLGEYSALAAAKGLTIAHTAQLLRTRGQAMQEAVPLGVGGMAALLGINFEQAQALASHAAQDQVCTVANDNSSQQVVLSGHLSAIERAIAAARDFGASRAILLNVSAPFHCPLMTPAAQIMHAALAQAPIQDLTLDLIANVSASPVRNATLIKQSLVEQVTGQVRWREIVQFFKQNGIQQTIEIGAGKVLTGLIKRTEPELEAISLNTPQDIDLFLNQHARSNCA